MAEDINFFDTKFLDKFNDGNLSSKDYLVFPRTDLWTYGFPDENNIMVLTKSYKKKINQLYISTTDLQPKKEIINEYTENDLLDLESKNLIILERDNKTNKVKSIKTNYNADIDSIIGKSPPKEFYKNLPSDFADDFNSKENRIDRHVHSVLSPKKIIATIPFNENNLDEI